MAMASQRKLKKTAVETNFLAFWSLPTTLVFGVSVSVLLGLEAWFWIFQSASLLDDLYFQATPSNEMMQTLDLAILAEHPMKSLWYLHYQPPGFDVFRLLLSTPEIVSQNDISNRAVDIRIYMMYAIFYGFINAIIYFWSFRHSRSVIASSTVTIGWAIYPGNLFIATFLDSMYLAAFVLVLIAHFWFLGIMLQRISYIAVAGFGIVALAMIRTNIQPIALLLLLILGFFVAKKSLITRHKQALSFGLILLLGISLVVPLKQFVLFGTVSSTTSSGHHLLGLIRNNPYPAELDRVEIPERIIRNGQMFQNKQNNVDEVIINYQYSKIFFKEVIKNPVLSLEQSLISAKRSLIKASGATHGYQPNVLVSKLLWSKLFENVFSGLSYILVVSLGFVMLFTNRRYPQNSNLRVLLFTASPIIVLLVSVGIMIIFGAMRYSENPAMGAGFGWNDGFAWTESNRLKFLLEVVVFPLAIYGWVAQLRRFSEHSLTR